MIRLGITDHIEGARQQRSREIFDEIIEQTQLADKLGFEYAWFAEHHAHAHAGHVPTPLLFALHLAGLTRRISLGTAIICLNLHHPVTVAEQVAMADVLTNGRMAVGFGSGSTSEEFAIFNQAEPAESERHARFAESLSIIRDVWQGKVENSPRKFFSVPAHAPLPIPAEDLLARSWLAVNSVSAARIAGSFNFNILFSHLRTAEEYQTYRAAYQAAGGTRLVAANRPVYVSRTDETAYAEAEPALRTLWRRFQSEGKISAAKIEPRSPQELCAHPINFTVGSPQTVADKLLDLHRRVPYDVANLEVRWTALPAHLIRDSLRCFAHEVRPILDRLI